MQGMTDELGTDEKESLGVFLCRERLAMESEVITSSRRSMVRASIHICSNDRRGP